MGSALIGKQPSRHARRKGAEAGPTEEAMDAVLQRAVAGDHKAFAELWCELQPRLLRYLRVRSSGSHEDVAAETWLHVVRDIRRFEGNADRFRAWLFTVARNRSIDAARAAAARPVILVPDLAVEGKQPTAASAEAEALDHISTDAAIELVKQLPPEQADMVMLRVVAGLDVPIVAQIVGKSPGAVRVSVHRGLRALSRNPTIHSEVV